MSNSKEVLINSIKEWITINDNINELQKSLKQLKDNKKKISSGLINIMESNNIDMFDINNGKLVYRKSKVKAAINKSYLLETLESYFKEYPEVDVNDVGSFILDNRPVKENQTLIIRQTKE